MTSRSSFSAKGLLIGLTLLVAAAGARMLTPTLHGMGNVPLLEDTLPKAIGEWKLIETATMQVGLSTDTSMSQPYNQSVMRSYTDNQGHVISLAVAWGEKQRQEIKIHRPELCYPAQGLQVVELTDITFPIVSANGSSVIGKRLLTRDHNGQYEIVSYWIRIGSVYSDSAWQTRKHIFTEGLAGRIPDGVLVRVSQRAADPSQVNAVYQRQEAFAQQLVAHTEPHSRDLLVR
jgi:EpsI family protein